jgi:uncharacterized protein YcbK (DUF882 family)
MALKHFKLEEFNCKHCGKNLMDEEFLHKLDNLRDMLGFPLVVTSGYRCPEYNKQVSTTGEDGPHTTGHAADFAVSHVEAFELVALAIAVGFTGFGIHQRGAGRFIHLDDLEENRPRFWSY